MRPTSEPQNGSPRLARRDCPNGRSATARRGAAPRGPRLSHRGRSASDPYRPHCRLRRPATPAAEHQSLLAWGDSRSRIARRCASEPQHRVGLERRGTLAPMKGDRVEVVVAADDGSRTYEIVATRAGRRVEITTGRGIVEVVEVTRTGEPVRTARFMASRVVALVEHPASEDRKTREISDDAS
jgi:hypothetical protein